MSEDQALALTGTFGAIVLVGASLIARRLPAGTMLKLGVIWAAIFAVVIAIIAAFQ